jgi:CubicO group peptidase (beta-lactamase class C family)
MTEPRIETDTRLGLPAPHRRALEAAARELQTQLSAGFPSGAAAALVTAEGVAGRIWGGWASRTPEQVPVAADTRFDLASLTKVTVTTSLALLLRDEGTWSLDDPIARWVRGFPREDITIRHCLTHTSGLPAHRPFYRLPSRAAFRAALFEEARLSPGPPAAVVYSDLNFILLGWALTAASATPLRRLARTRLLEPLGMAATDFRPPARLRRRIAATEVGGDQRPQSGTVWGEVHDGNAWALGGVSGHAGLFAPVDDMARFVGALLRTPHPVLSATSIDEMATRQAGEPPEVRSLGWRLDPAAWGEWPPRTFWHTGFTGTSLLVAPALGVGVVLLTNAVHPIRRPDDQARMRVVFHRAVLGALAETRP